MSSCAESIRQNIGTTLTNSAHSIFQFGQYYDCIETKGFSYNLIYIAVNHTNSGMFGGFCLPDTCSKTYIEDTINQGFIMAQLPDYSVLAVINDIEEYQYPFTWLFFVTSVIICCMVGFVLFSSLSKSKNKIITSASMQKTMKIFQYKESQLGIFNGIRAIAMMWVVFGHYYLNSVGGVVNTLNLENIILKPFFLVVETGLLAVDIFFFLGGFFLAFVFLREKVKKNITYLFAIIQRVLRIWPAYILVMMIYYSFFMHMGDGPRWQFNEPTINLCSRMWKSILFVDNLVDNGEEMCLNWGWYLQADFQIFLSCLVLLFIYNKVNKKASYVIAGVLVLCSWSFNIYYTQKHNQKLFTTIQALFGMGRYVTDVYIKPYARCCPYYMGLFLGIAYYQMKQSWKDANLLQNKKVKVLISLKQMFKNSPLKRRVIQWSGIALMAFLTFILRTLQTGHQWPQIWHSIYGCMEKPLFIVGIIMVVLPTVLGCKQSFFRLILDNKLFNFMAKISFCTYLVHLIILIQYIFSRTEDSYYSIIDAFPAYLGCLVLSCFFGFLVTVFVEVPCSQWLKEAVSKLKKKGIRVEKESISMDASQSLVTNDEKMQQK